MHEKAVSIIQDYIDTYLFEPGRNWPEYYFKERSYSRWIANEILERIKKQTSISPIDIIEDFINKLDNWSCVDDKIWPNVKPEEIFSIARDTAEEIGCLFV